MLSVLLSCVKPLLEDKQADIPVIVIPVYVAVEGGSDFLVYAGHGRRFRVIVGLPSTWRSVSEIGQSLCTVKLSTVVA